MEIKTAILKTSHHTVNSSSWVEDVVSQLQKALRLENEQHLREILLKMPPQSLTLDRLVPMADHLPRQPVGKTNEGVPSGANIPETSTVDRKSDRDSEKLEEEQKRQTGPASSLKAPSKTASPSDPPRNDTVNPPENILLSLRQEVIAIQKDIYAQIMSSLLQYKIDLYRNLLRVSLDLNPEANKKANHKNFMLLRNLQQMIAKSSESNFESWYKFYSYSVFPKINKIVGQIDSISKSSGGAPKTDIKSKLNEYKALNDDFFVRAGDPIEAKGGFDWSNLDKKIRETMRVALKHVRPHNTLRGDEANFAEARDEKEKRDNLKGDFRKRKVPEDKHNPKSDDGEEPGKYNKRRGYESEGRTNDKPDDGRKDTHEKHKYAEKYKNEPDKKHQKREHAKYNHDDVNRAYQESVRYERMKNDNCHKKADNGRDSKRKRNKFEYRRKKMSFSDVGKYFKNSASGLWKKVKDGFKNVKDYSEIYMKDWGSGKAESGSYKEWREQFVKEMKDVVQVLGGNPTLASLYEVPKSVSQFFGDGLATVLGSFEEERQPEERGPEGVNVAEDVVEGVNAGDEGYESCDDRRHHHDWYLVLGRHRAYLRRRGIHLDDDGSWFISSAKHRAKMRQKHGESPHSQYFHAQASSKR